MAKLATFVVMCKAYRGEPSVDLLRAFLNLGPAGDWLTLSNRGGSGVPKAVTKPITHIEGWKGSFFYIENKIVPSKYLELPLEDNKLDKKSFMMEGIDGEFHFELEGGVGDGEVRSPSIMSVNNEASVIDAEPLNFAPPSQFTENIMDSDDAPSEENARKVLPQASKASGDPSYPLDVDSDSDFHEFPSAKELKDSADYHWVVAHVTPPSTHKLISTLAKARASCDAIRVREKDKDKAYAELEKKCNDALQDLDKNPLVLDMHAENKTLQGQVDRLHGEYSRLILEEKKVVVVAKVVPHMATKLVHSDEMGLLVAWHAKAALFHGKSTTLEEVAALKEPFKLEKMPGYRPISKKEFD
ncbi:hypothetical protein Tco_1230690 [Tanacetum coccineum]